MADIQTSMYSQYWEQVLVKDDFLRFSRQITAELLLSLLDTYQVVASDQSDLEIQNRLEETNGFRAIIWNMVPHKPAGWATIGTPNEHAILRHKFSTENTVPVSARFSQVMRMTNQLGGLLVTKDGQIDGEPLGVIFPESFNCPASRSFFYQWILTVELEMTALLEAIYKSPDTTWVQYISEDRYRNLTTEFENARQLEPKLRFIQTLYFSDLANILIKSKACQEISRRDFDSIANLRNQVMHPIRLLVDGPDRLGRLEHHYNTLKRLTSVLRLRRTALQSDSPH